MAIDVQPSGRYNEENVRRRRLFGRRYCNPDSKGGGCSSAAENLCALCGENSHAVFGFMKGLDDAASESLVEALFTPKAQELYITATEVIGSAFRNRVDISPVLT